jgi:hypothetical protein
VLSGRGGQEHLRHATDGETLDKLIPAEADREIAHRSQP